MCQLSLPYLFGLYKSPWWDWSIKTFLSNLRLNLLIRWWQLIHI